MIEIEYREDGYPISVVDGDKELEFLPWDDFFIDVSCSFEEIKRYFKEGFPDNIKFTAMKKKSKILENSPIGLVDIKKENNKIILYGICSFNEDYNDSRWSYKVLCNEINNQIRYFDAMAIGEIVLDNDPSIGLIKESPMTKDIEDCIGDFVVEVEKLFFETEISLGEFRWKDIYDNNEAVFCNEVITPLLRRMNFLSVKYNHGCNEFGKDYILSELTAFGNLRYYGVQVKAGDIKGSVNSNIDEIIGQVEDAFTMPFIELNTKEFKYISTLIIIISGKYTLNAKQKIMNKIPKGNIGSIYFLDREDINNLIQEKWHIGTK